MKVSELTGAQLDYWVAKAEGMKAHVHAVNDTNIPYCIVTSDKWHGDKFFLPHTHWHDGGPIIEREKIDIAWQALSWFAEHPIDDRGAFGPTPLIAAMRAYVASKYGVEVPDNPA